MGEAPDDIREDIEETRARMGETAEAIGYKTDVKSRVKDKVTRVTGSVSDAVPDREQVKSGARKVGMSAENPLGLAVAGAAVGFVVGTLLPSTSSEDEKLGGMSDQVGEKVRETGQEALERGKDVAREAVDSARQTVTEEGSEQAQEMTSSLRDKAQEVGSSTPS